MNKWNKWKPIDSTNIDEINKIDLRGKRCSLCGVRLTKKNFRVLRVFYAEGQYRKMYFCKDCFFEEE